MQCFYGATWRTYHDHSSPVSALSLSLCFKIHIWLYFGKLHSLDNIKYKLRYKQNNNSNRRNKLITKASFPPITDTDESWRWKCLRMCLVNGQREFDGHVTHTSARLNRCSGWNCDFNWLSFKQSVKREQRACRFVCHHAHFLFNDRTSY